MRPTTYNTFLVALFLSQFASSIPIQPSRGPDPGYAHPSNGICADYTIKEEITTTNQIWVYPPLANDFDVAQALANISSKEPSTGYQPLSGVVNVTKTYEIAGTFCTPKEKKGGKETIVLVATHGVGYDRRYWASSYMPEQYNFAQYALESGYSIFYYDRLGVGKSERISGYDNQAIIQAALLTKITEAIHNGAYTSDIKASKVALVGHSFGSILSSAVTSDRPDLVDALVLTGWAYPNDTDPAAFAPVFTPTVFASRLVSNTSGYGTGYLDFGDIYAHVQAFMHQPGYDIATAKYAYSISQPYGIAEFLSGRALNLQAADYKGSVLLAAGKYDVLLCGGDCADTFEGGVQDMVYPSASKIEPYVQPGAGHGGNFGTTALELYKTIVEFLDSEL
ncbi:alpha/beta-hydrolase [Trematosphaeria pertusa]|uniref:Alpha/beta-hydrolase n=1 Tax=Trematosphaeria pertusa TaxID=390896 RepID=A0A6A6J1Z9_9PLEO|nr:alpha/beta-hydrolase [Trematosphaeria pertusa]KAF2256696.1 alpha/beta-hydrolase [Trematosphaeria pertusa]